MSRDSLRRWYLSILTFPPHWLTKWRLKNSVYTLWAAIILICIQVPAKYIIGPLFRPEPTRFSSVLPGFVSPCFDQNRCHALIATTFYEKVVSLMLEIFFIHNMFQNSHLFDIFSVVRYELLLLLSLTICCSVFIFSCYFVFANSCIINYKQHTNLQTNSCLILSMTFLNQTLLN